MRLPIPCMGREALCFGFFIHLSECACLPREAFSNRLAIVFQLYLVFYLQFSCTWEYVFHSVCATVVACCRLQANLESELRRLQKESREKQNIIDEKEEEMYELESRIEKQVLYLYSAVNCTTVSELKSVLWCFRYFISISCFKKKFLLFSILIYEDYRVLIFDCSERLTICHFLIFIFFPRFYCLVSCIN